MFPVQAHRNLGKQECAGESKRGHAQCLGDKCFAFVKDCFRTC